MGCDIHCWVEARENSESPWRMTPIDLPLANERHYAMFAILADVRNRYDWMPIAQPRGVPADASPEFQEEIVSWGMDAHSASHHTLAQLLAYNWEWRRADGHSAAGFVGESFFNEDLAMMAKAGSPENVRIVFFFDN